MPTTATATAASPAQDRRSEPRALLPKKCRYCERRFSKAEHLKRHQRSHTGERPYTCPRCQKSFSRSDVLIRHLKNHPQIVGEEVEKSSSEGDFVDVNRAPNPNQTPVASSENNPITQNVRRQSQVQVASPSVIDPSLEDHLHRPTSNGLPSGLDHLALLASQQKWGNGTMDAVMADSGNAALPEMSAAPSWTLEMPNNGHVAHTDINFDPRPTQPDPSFQNIGPSPNASSRFNFGEDAYSNRLNGMQDQISPDMGGMAPDVSIMPQDLQTWFDQFDLESHLHPGNLQDFVTSNSQISGVRRGSSLTASDEPASVRNPSSPSTLIPNERFAKVERCWPNRHSNPLRLMPTLWWDAVMKVEDNLFSNGNLSPEAMEQNRQCGSRWGLDEDCRERLRRMFVTITHVSSDQTPAAFGSPDNFSSPSDSRSTGQAASVMNDAPLSSTFPPAEIFDIGLDLYFRQFHPLMPFIHTPTFCPKTAPTSILFVMCLIGLTILQTKGATAFVRQTFSKALEQVSIELMPSLTGDRSRIDQMSSLASAVLILNLTEMMGQKYQQSQCQMLYTNVIMTAQKHGLFNATDGQALNESFLGQISDLEARWKAWSRIECAKRLIVSLTMVDTWYSAMLHTSPIMRTDDIQVILPCDTALFQATTAHKWAHLAATRHQMCMPMVSLSGDVLSLPELNNTVEPLAMHGILSIIRLRISHDFHRLLSGCHRRADEQYFVPALTYDLDSRAKQTKSLVIHVMKSYDPLFTSINPNCIVLWHNTCIMLTSDVRLFEVGAGCAGAPAARQALDDIAVWTQTASARRACLHAAQTFKLMSNRRASDGDPFHASTGLFISALILGLYVFMVPPEADTASGNPGPASTGFDLIDDVDWTAVGGEGLGAASTEQINTSSGINNMNNINANRTPDDGAVNFIRNGGGICFDGVIHRPGYEAARRILLDYARLLEDIGRWRVRINQYSKVLRIMSDALVDVEMGGG